MAVVTSQLLCTRLRAKTLAAVCVCVCVHVWARPEAEEGACVRAVLVTHDSKPFSKLWGFQAPGSCFSRTQSRQGVDSLTPDSLEAVLFVLARPGMGNQDLLLLVYIHPHAHHAIEVDLDQRGVCFCLLFAFNHFFQR